MGAISFFVLSALTGSQARLYLPESYQPRRHVAVVRKVDRSIFKKRESIRQVVALREEKLAQGRKDALAKLQRAIPPKVVTEQQISVPFVTTRSAVASDLPVRITATTNKGKVVFNQRLRTDVGGRVQLMVKEFPVRVEVTLETENWAMTRPDESIVALAGTEGNVVASVFDRSSDSLFALEEVSLDEPYLVPRPSPLYPQTRKKSQGKTSKNAGQATQRKVVTIKRKVNVKAIEVEPTSVRFEFEGHPRSNVMVGSASWGALNESGTLSISVPVRDVPDELSLVCRSPDPEVSAESIVKVSMVDPYSVNRVSFPTLKLTAIKSIRVTGLPDEMDGSLLSLGLTNTLGKPEVIRDDPKQRTPPSLPLVEGTEWWKYSSNGVAFRMRKIVISSGKNGLDYVVERIRLIEPKGGIVGKDIRVGSSKPDVLAALGRGEPDYSLKDGSTETYLDGGLVLSYRDDTVQWIELRRPRNLLNQGIDFDSPEGEIRLFTSEPKGSFEKYPGAGPYLKSLIDRSPGFVPATAEADADMVINTELVDFKESMDKIVGAIPYKVSCELNMRYAISPAGAANGEFLSARGSAIADYERDVREGGTMILAAMLVAGLIKDSTTQMIVMAALGVSAAAAAENTRKAMVSAQERIRPIALEQAARVILDDLTRSAEIKLRVIEVDRRGARATLNCGRLHGISNGDTFELFNGNLPVFPGVVTPLAEDRIIGKVSDVKDREAILTLIHLKRSISKKGKEDVTEIELATENELLRSQKKELSNDPNTILEPSSGLVWARRVTVIK